MKHTRNRTMLAVGAVAGATLLFALSVTSAPHFQGGPGGPHRGAHLLQSLDLSEEQRAKVDAQMSASRDATRADRERMRELREQARNLREDFDAGRAQQIADEMGQITSRLAYAKISGRAQVYALLDDEQREALAAKVERHKAWRKGWREGHRSQGF